MTSHAEVVSAVNKIQAEYDFPLTVRQIHYRLVSIKLIPNTQSAYKGLDHQLVKARENGEVDDTRIEDRARQVLEAKKGYEDSDQFVDTMKYWFKSLGEQYKANLWDGQRSFVEVWVEKDALSALIHQAVEPYRVSVCPCRGYSSYTYIKRGAIDGRFSEVDKPIILLYLGDHDPSGLQMTEDLENRFAKYGESLNITAKRIALSIDQVRKYKLLPNPTKKADSRSSAYVSEFGDECWELDAVEPRELQRIVKHAIEDEIDMQTWKHSLEQEEADRAELMERFRKARLSV